MINEIKEIKNIPWDERFDFLLKNAFFIDIETTGLSRDYSDIISITLLYFHKNSFILHQVFCQYRIDEHEALKYLKDLVKNKKFVITYNGNSFDIPFLSTKFKKHLIEFDFDFFIKLDLYNWMRQFKNKINLENLKLKTIEKHFNIERKDTLQGEDIITLYEAYKIEPRKEFSSLILQHNYEDVLNLPTLFNSIISLYDEVLFYDSLVVKINNEDFKISKNSLICSFNILTDFNTDYIHSHIDYNLKVNYKNQKMSLTIPLGFFMDEKIHEFYYIDNEIFKIKSFTGIKGIKKNLVPVKFNDKIFYNNIIDLVKIILSPIFDCH